MQPTRTATAIEVGVHGERVGFRMTFADGTSEVFLFDDATASSLFHQGIAVVEQFRQSRAQRSEGLASSAGLADYAKVRLVP